MTLGRLAVNGHGTFFPNNRRRKMKRAITSRLKALPFVLMVALSGGWALLVAAHCNTMSGPVIQDAQLALQKGDVTPILKWVKPADEAQIREAFKRTLAVRTKGPEAKDLADQYFFETLVRIHREGEGAPYTGIKPAGTEVEPGIEAADRAIETGSADALVKAMTAHVAEGIRQRFAKVTEAKKHKEESVEAGREYVEAYVIFIHYVERLHADAMTNPSHHGEQAGAPAEAHHE